MGSQKSCIFTHFRPCPKSELPLEKSEKLHQLRFCYPRWQRGLKTVVGTCGSHIRHTQKTNRPSVVNAVQWCFYDAFLLPWNWLSEMKVTLFLSWLHSRSVCRKCMEKKTLHCSQADVAIHSLLAIQRDVCTLKVSLQHIHGYNLVSALCAANLFIYFYTHKYPAVA